MQQCLVVFLNPQFADIVGRSVIGFLAFDCQFLQIPFVNACHIAQYMGQRFGVGVKTFQAGFDTDAGKAVLIYRKQRHLFFGHAAQQRDRLKAALTGHIFTKIVQAIGINAEQAG